MPRGGSRPGAGRKKGFSAKNAEEMRKVLAELIEPELVPMAKAMIHKVKSGDLSAFKELMDRAYGRPFQIREESKPDFMDLMRERIRLAKENHLTPD